MTRLSKEDQQLVDEVDRTLGRYLDTIRCAQQFKLNDFLILKLSHYGSSLKLSHYDSKMSTLTNSYGAPIKYKVVHVNAQGIPFIKRINKNGEPIGRLSSCIGVETDEYYHNTTIFAFELDPDYADSIILQDDYDPASLHRSKKDIWKAITQHNKACKIPSKIL